MAYRTGSNLKSGAIALAALVATAFLCASDTVHAARQPYKRHFTSQESRRRPAQYRRDEVYGYTNAWRNFKVKKDKVARLKRSSFWNKRPYQFATPLVTNGKLFVGVDAGYFYAFRVPREKKLWRFKTEGAVQAPASWLDGTVFVGDGKGILYAIDAETGKEKWRKTLDTEIMSKPLIVGSTIYIPTMSGRMFSIDAYTGSENWHTAADEKDFGFSIRSSASPSAGMGLIFQGTATGDVRALRQSDGQVIWATRLGSPQSRIYDVDSTPLLEEGQLFAASADHLLYSLNPNDGSVNWVSDAGGVNNIVYKNGRIYTTGGGELYCIDPSSGLVFWSQAFDKPAMSSPAAGDGFIAVVSTIDKIFIVESATGDIAYERYVRKGSLGNPIVVDDKDVYILSNSGRLFSFEVEKKKKKTKKGKKVATGDEIKIPVTDNPSENKSEVESDAEKSAE